MAVSISKFLLNTARQTLFEGVPIYSLNLERKDRDRIERVGYMLRYAEKHPDTDVFTSFKQLAAGRYDSAMEEWHAAKKDMVLYEALVKLKATTQ